MKLTDEQIEDIRKKILKDVGYTSGIERAVPYIIDKAIHHTLEEVDKDCMLKKDAKSLIQIACDELIMNHETRLREIRDALEERRSVYRESPTEGILYRLIFNVPEYQALIKLIGVEGE